jgi:hypothetical protein
MAAPTKELLTHFDRLHVEHVGERAVIQGAKDAKLLAGLCASHGPERVKELMALFFTVEDEWIANTGYTVGVFVSQCGKLIARDRKSAIQKPQQRGDWRFECRELHGGRCSNVHFHEAMKERAS